MPTPTGNASLALRRADFETLWEGLDYAARGEAGFNFFSARGELKSVLPYRDLAERARDLARRLSGLRLARGDRMVLIADTDPEFCVAFMATQYAGILPVPVAIPTSLGGRAAYIEQLRSQIEGCGAVAAWSTDELLPFLREAVEGLPLRMAGGPGDFAALTHAAGDPTPFSKDEQSYLQYSSGSTRFPKGIDIPQRVLMANAYAIGNHGLQVRPGDRCASWLPFYHDMGLVGFMLSPMLNQLSTDYLATRDFARRSLTWLQLISEHRATLAYSPSFGYDLCVRRLRDGSDFKADLSCWRAAGIGGDMVQHAVLKRFADAFGPFGFRDTAFCPSYGMAETTLAMTFAPLETRYVVDYVAREGLERDRAEPAGAGPDARGFVACGPALPGHEIEVRDAAGQKLPERRIGRVFFRGPSVMTGYFRQPELTRETLSPEGWLDTGDLGYLLDGEIVITGRAKDLIILNGRNIWPQDLEWAAEDAIAELRRGDVAAISVENAADGDAERIVVLVQCRSTDAAARERLKAEVAAVLQKSMAVETTVVLVPPHGLPQTSSGKLSRARAKVNFLGGVYDRADAAAAV
ncbi:MAG TPA: fatty acyl-AMP ligase [Candidatus Binatia bacterium]|nr:fatty acyl-AMP ligase [Candidatus Binatia bacterium]